VEKSGFWLENLATQMILTIITTPLEGFQVKATETGLEERNVDPSYHYCS